MAFLAAAALSGGISCGSGPGPVAIVVDGRFGDWEGRKPAWSEPAGDGSAAGIDIKRVWLASRGKTLFIRFELGEELSLQSDNALALHLDTDLSPETGLPVAGIGADLSWYFGGRTGCVRTGAGETMCTAYDLGIVTAPTVTSRQFEVKLRGDGDAAGLLSPLFPSDAIRWVLKDEGSDSGDVACGPALFTLDDAPLPLPPEEVPMGKTAQEHLRVVTYNVYNDGLFKRKEPFRRILKAMEPDVIHFQEISGHSAEETRSLVSGMLGGSWHAAGCGDTVTVSRYPIVLERPLAGNLGVMIDLPDEKYSCDIFMINAHLPSGRHDRERQRETDAISSFIRVATRPGGAVTLPPGTPILLAGDLNFVGFSRQLKTLLTGDVADDGTFGPDRPPDWDSSPMTDVLAYHTGAPEVYTWWREGDSMGFGPGRLDYIIYTDSVISPAKSFVLCTETMSPSGPACHGLRRDDTSAASDHLPVVVDFIVPGIPRRPLPGEGGLR